MSMRNITAFGTTGSLYIFYSCTGLKVVWIGSAITDNGFKANVFNKCSNLKKSLLIYQEQQYKHLLIILQNGVVIR